MKKSCPMGYTDNDLKRILGPSYDRFQKWMVGQTVTVCDGREYDHAQGGYIATTCKDNPHGIVVYSSDLRQFMSGGHPLD